MNDSYEPVNCKLLGGPLDGTNLQLPVPMQIDRIDFRYGGPLVIPNESSSTKFKFLFMSEEEYESSIKTVSYFPREMFTESELADPDWVFPLYFDGDVRRSDGDSVYRSLDEP